MYKHFAIIFLLSRCLFVPVTCNKEDDLNKKYITIREIYRDYVNIFYTNFGKLINCPSWNLNIEKCNDEVNDIKLKVKEFTENSDVQESRDKLTTLIQYTDMIKRENKTCLRQEENPTLNEIKILEDSVVFQKMMIMDAFKAYFYHLNLYITTYPCYTETSEVTNGINDFKNYIKELNLKFPWVIYEDISSFGKSFISNVTDFVTRMNKNATGCKEKVKEFDYTRNITMNLQTSYSNFVEKIDKKEVEKFNNSIYLVPSNITNSEIVLNNKRERLNEIHEIYVTLFLKNFEIIKNCPTRNLTVEKCNDVINDIKLKIININENTDVQESTVNLENLYTFQRWWSLEKNKTCMSLKRNLSLNQNKIWIHVIEENFNYLQQNTSMEIKNLLIDAFKAYLYHLNLYFTTTYPCYIETSKVTNGIPKHDVENYIKELNSTVPLLRNFDSNGFDINFKLGKSFVSNFTELVTGMNNNAAGCKKKFEESDYTTHIKMNLKTFEDCVDDIVKNLMNKNYFPQVCKINVSETATVSETTKGLETITVSVRDNGIDSETSQGLETITVSVRDNGIDSETSQGLETTKISVTISTDSGIVVSNSAQSVFSFVPIWGIPPLLLVLMAII
ncbi:uncharacterized protein LOC127289047 isoform X2 [Leptopilina boulardi]|uniref:uncharacterized protein LOC127289047 isoform X2 n=1 Tax=Leptopilina boulardi TaxID=63433 RepID=UPI0021F5B9C5|nr:uncharacterized protein LOC127289047 isoform X2 [Leptopilina boulardi]